MLTQDQLNTLRDRLMNMKNENEAQLPEETHANEAEETGELSNADNHPGDSATELHEREKDVAIENQSREGLSAIEKALQAIDDGTCGKCEVCGAPISYERLEIVPETLRCVEHADEEKSFSNNRPVEEDVIEPSLETDDDIEEEVIFDREDTWETVRQHGTSQSPSDFLDSDIGYNESEEEEDSGRAEEVEDLPVSDMEGENTGVTSEQKEHGKDSRNIHDEDTKDRRS